MGWLEDFAYTLVSQYGYLGVFVVSFLSSATVFFPVPSHIIVFLFSVDNYPLFIGLLAAVGSCLGELTSYGVGRGSLKLLEKYEREIEKWKEKINRYGMFALLIVFAATPLPDDVLGIFAGVARYDLKKFLLATFIGKALMYVFIAYTGSFFWEWAL